MINNNNEINMNYYMIRQNMHQGCFSDVYKFVMDEPVITCPYGHTFEATAKH